MSMPWIRKKQTPAIIIATRKKESIQESSSALPEEEHDSIEIVAEDMISALEAKDAKKLACCLRAAFELMEMDEEDSEEDSEDGSFESQNIKAAKSVQE